MKVIYLILFLMSSLTISVRFSNAAIRGRNRIKDIDWNNLRLDLLIESLILLYVVYFWKLKFTEVAR